MELVRLLFIILYVFYGFELEAHKPKHILTERKNKELKVLLIIFSIIGYTYPHRYMVTYRGLGSVILNLFKKVCTFFIFYVILYIRNKEGDETNEKIKFRAFT